MKMKLLVALTSCSFGFALANDLPNIEIIATGGTIAGASTSQVSTKYKAGLLSPEQIISSVNGIHKIANISVQQVYSKDSGDVTNDDWIKLATAVQTAANNSKYNGLVITHGTDTLEETAYFLSLVLKTSKPVVFVGSMRPATGMSADGPMNLYNAVAIAGDQSSESRGVVVAMNEKIYDARNVTKGNTTSVDTFVSPNSGPIGSVFMGTAKYHSIPVYPTTINTPFTINSDTKLPSVAVIYEHAGVNTEMLDHILETSDLKGIVIAGVGDGNIPSYEKDFLLKARKKGIVIVRSSRAGSGEVTYDYNSLDTTYDLVEGNNLNPQKARILLMLSLLKTNNIKTIQKYFDTY